MLSPQPHLQAYGKNGTENEWVLRPATHGCAQSRAPMSPQGFADLLLTCPLFAGEWNVSTHQENQHDGSVDRRTFIARAGLLAAAPLVDRLLASGTAVASPVAKEGTRDEARWETCLRLARALLL